MNGNAIFKQRSSQYSFPHLSFVSRLDFGLLLDGKPDLSKRELFGPDNQDLANLLNSDISLTCP